MTEAVVFGASSKATLNTAAKWARKARQPTEEENTSDVKSRVASTEEKWWVENRERKILARKRRAGRRTEYL